MLLECQNVLLLLFVFYSFIYSGRLVGDVSFRRIFLISFISIFWLVMWVWKGFFLFFLFSFILIFWLVMWVSEGFFLFFYFLFFIFWLVVWVSKVEPTSSVNWELCVARCVEERKCLGNSLLPSVKILWSTNICYAIYTLIHGALCFNLERLSSVFVF